MAANDAPIEMRVEIRDLVFRAATGDFCVLEAEVSGREAVIVVGHFPWSPAKGEWVTVRGRFESHPKFGRQLRAQVVVPDLPVEHLGIERFLASGLFKGVGAKLARTLVQRFGAATLQVIENEPGRLREVKGLGAKRGAALSEHLKKARAEKETFVFLYGLGLGPSLVAEIWREFGVGAMAEVGRNPYGLVQRVRGIGFKTADELARRQGLASDAPERLRAGLEEALREAADLGHAALPLADLLDRATKLLQVSRAHVEARLDLALTEGTLRADRTEGVPGSELLWRPVLHEAELEAARLLRGRLESGAVPAIPRPNSDEAVPWSAEQESAIDLLLRNSIAILTGGPGVGKTSILREVVRCAQASKLKVALASPTGRAARRLAEACGAPATTLHRLLGILPDGRGPKGAKPIEADLLIVDETSMVDLLLLVRLLRRLPSLTRLVLVGDPDQLPSIGPGSVLRDLLDARCFPTAHLTRVWRQGEGSDIVRAAHAILRGVEPVYSGRSGAGDFYFLERPDSERGHETVIELFLERLPRRYGLDPRRDIQILAPMHKGAVGTEALNEAVQRRLAPPGQGLMAAGRRFFEGDRVMVLRNDHEREIANGDLGQVVRLASTTDAMEVQFEDRIIRFEGEQLVDLQPAYAITIHKAQGGEFPVVILPIFPEHHLLLQRAVVYTALTRARKLLVLVGDRGAWLQAIADDRRQRRFGALSDRLSGRSRPFVFSRAETGNPGIFSDSP